MGKHLGGKMKSDTHNQKEIPMAQWNFLNISLLTQKPFELSQKGRWETRVTEFNGRPIELMHSAAGGDWN